MLVKPSYFYISNCYANQLTGFYMRAPPAINALNINSIGQMKNEVTLVLVKKNKFVILPSQSFSGLTYSVISNVGASSVITSHL